MKYRHHRFGFALAAIAAAALCGASPSFAKAKKPKAEPATRGGAILVSNQRDSTLLELTATPQNGGAEITIARDVAAGARAAGKLPAKAGCVFNLSGRFEDESSMEAANLNLCKDGRINLVE